MKIEFRWATKNGETENAVRDLMALATTIHVQVGIALMPKFSRNVNYLEFSVGSLNQLFVGEDGSFEAYVKVQLIESELRERGICAGVYFDGLNAVQFAAKQSEKLAEREDTIKEAIAKLDDTKRWIKHPDFRAISDLLRKALGRN